MSKFSIRLNLVKDESLIDTSEIEKRIYYTSLKTENSLHVARDDDQSSVNT